MDRYYIRLQDTLTGVIRDIGWDYPDGFVEEDVIYYWTEGNGSCDCNRGLEFNRVRELPDPDFDCGNERMKLLGIWHNDVQIVETE